ncbi:MAG TPA: hypothetical protein VG425_01300 [Casimicrobiaceae bacterium]|jgi:hypothetical protein|nr:hypothetical protein [Casimicrobiaceae bacterium]
MAIINVRRGRRFGASRSSATASAKNLSFHGDGGLVDQRKVFVLGCCAQVVNNPGKD